jgi:hypothetical protein
MIIFAIINREVIIEKHWRGVISRAVCDFFWDEVNKYDSKEVSWTGLPQFQNFFHVLN